MPTSRIHVRRDIIARDGRQGTAGNAIGVETSGMRKRYGRFVYIDGPAVVMYRPDRPLSCGAKAWIQTDANVRVKR